MALVACGEPVLRPVLRLVSTWPITTLFLACSPTEDPFQDVVEGEKQVKEERANRAHEGNCEQVSVLAPPQLHVVHEWAESGVQLNIAVSERWMGLGGASWPARTPGTVQPKRANQAY